MSERPYRPGLPALFDVVHRLRAPGGCPWDREQTHASLRPYLVEEAYEAVEAIDVGDDARLQEELGDVLLQVAMHAEIAAQEGRFDAAQVSEAAAAKMVARHPHVFGEAVAATADDVLANWERLKAAEARSVGKPESVFDRVPAALPGLAWAVALQSRAARLGLVDPELGRPERVADETAQLAGDASPAEREARLGDLLFGIAALARELDLDPEAAIRAAGRRFRARMEALSAAAEPPS